MQTFILKYVSGAGLVNFELFTPINATTVSVRKVWRDGSGFAPEQMTTEAARKWWKRATTELGYRQVDKVA